MEYRYNVAKRLSTCANANVENPLSIDSCGSGSGGGGGSNFIIPTKNNVQHA